MKDILQDGHRHDRVGVEERNQLVYNKNNKIIFRVKAQEEVRDTFYLFDGTLTIKSIVDAEIPVPNILGR